MPYLLLGHHSGLKEHGELFDLEYGLSSQALVKELIL